MCSALPTDSASPSLFRALLDPFDYINVPTSDELDLGPPHLFSPSLPLKETSDGTKAHAMATFGGACPCGAQGSPGERPAQHSHGSAWRSTQRGHNARNNRAATGREPRTLTPPTGVDAASLNYLSRMAVTTGILGISQTVDARTAILASWGIGLCSPQSESAVLPFTVRVS